MARIFDEQLEIVGYDETWSHGETIGSGCTLDEDHNATNATNPAPSGWGSKCLKVIGLTGTQTFVEHRPTWSSGSLHFRVEVVVGSAPSSGANPILYATDSTGAIAFKLNIYNPGTLQFRFQIYNNGTQTSYNSGAISTGTRYRVEIQYDFTNNLWEWRIDGSTQNSGSLTGTYRNNIGRLYAGLGVPGSNVVADTTAYLDLIAVDNADWIGAETGGSIVDATAVDGVDLSDTPSNIATLQSLAADGVDLADAAFFEEDTFYYASGVPSDADYKVEANFTFDSTAGGAFLLGRVATASNTFYGGGYNHETGQWELIKRVNGVETLLDSWVNTPSGTVAVRLEVYDSGKALYIADTLRCSSADNAITDAGRAGLRFIGTDVVHVDDYTATVFPITHMVASDGLKLSDIPTNLADLLATATDILKLIDSSNHGVIEGTVIDGIKFSDLATYIIDLGSPVEAVDANKKTIDWFFDVTDNLGGTYKWSTKDKGAYSFKVDDFYGVNLRRNQTEDGIIAPSTLRFAITNKNNTLNPDLLEGGSVTLRLVFGTEEIVKWTFNIKQALSLYQKIEIECEDFLSAYLEGEWPNTPRVAELFPSDDTDKSGLCVPVTFGTAYIPLHSILSSGQRYYVLGSSTKTYTISEVRTPREFGRKTVWNSNDFTFTQSNKTDGRSETWRVFQPIIADSDADGTADACGLWKSGDAFLPMPTKFSASDTVSMTGYADVIEAILLDMGVPAAQIDSAGSFTTAATLYASLGLTCNIGYYYQRPRREVLGELLAACHSVFRITDKVELHPLSKSPVLSVTSADILKKTESGEGTFQIQDIRDFDNDAGYVAIPKSGDSQDTLYRILVPAKNTWDNISQDTLNLPMLTDSAKAQTAASLFFQRRFMKDKGISFMSKATLAKVNPDQVLTISGSNYGGTYDVLVDQIRISEDLELGFYCIKFKDDLDDWTDQVFSPVTINEDGTANVWEVITAGPDTSTPSSGNPPNSLPGRLFIGSTILFDPASGGKIHISDDLGALTNDVAFNIADKLFFDKVSGKLTVGDEIFVGSEIAGAGLVLDGTYPYIKAYAGSNKVEMTPGGLEGYDSVLGQTFKLSTDGSAPIFASGIVKEVEFQVYTSGVIKTSADPTSDGGCLMNNTRIAGYSDDSSPIKLFEFIYSGVDQGDAYIGDYGSGETNHGIFYDHSEADLNIKGSIKNYGPDGSFSELTHGYLAFVDGDQYSYAYTKRVILGEASDGDTVTFTPEFFEIPKVVVIPKAVKTYKSTSSNDQYIRNLASGVTTTGFVVVSELYESGGAETTQDMNPTSIVTPPGNSVITSTDTDVTEITFVVKTLGWTKVSAYQEQNGYKVFYNPYEFLVKLEYRPVSGTWVTVGGGNLTFVHYPNSSDYNTGKVHTYKITGATSGQYEVRITLISKSLIQAGGEWYYFYAPSNPSAPSSQIKDLQAVFAGANVIAIGGDVIYLAIG